MDADDYIVHGNGDTPPAPDADGIFKGHLTARFSLRDFPDIEVTVEAPMFPQPLPFKLMRVKKVLGPLEIHAGILFREFGMTPEDALAAGWMRGHFGFIMPEQAHLFDPHLFDWTDDAE